MMKFLKKLLQGFIDSREAQAAEHIRKWRQNGTIPSEDN